MDKNRNARRGAIAGLAVGVASMIVMFIVGAVNGSAPMMVIAGSTAVAVAIAGTTAIAAVNKKAKASA